jgi:carbonic anhydrase
MPESYFEGIKKGNPGVDIEFHDKYLSDMVDTEMKRSDEDRKPLDMTKFVELLDYNRRWSYQGSLTTIPCSEGILWNVLEHVIPIRQ